MIPTVVLAELYYGAARHLLRSLKSFRDEYPESKAIFLYRGRERLLREGILCLPCGDFLRHLHPDKTIDDACLPRTVPKTGRQFLP